jgi:hypothetical protein
MMDQRRQRSRAAAFPRAAGVACPARIRAPESFLGGAGKVFEFGVASVTKLTLGSNSALANAPELDRLFSYGELYTVLWHLDTIEKC